MGFTIIPKCNNCGYKTDSIAVGGGRFSYLTHCGAPALNIESNEIEEINLYDYTKTEIVKKRFLYFFYKSVTIVTKNEKYIPYYKSSMFKNDVGIGSYNWGSDYYKKSKNFCPKCKTFDLDFLMGVLFD
ncbi:hypothetical protein [Flavobacterium daejeonense]|uniref:hypothetical protein n=1 Tax=Flavobacterium daejeonense TaxID=350893 RepID=UPI00047D8174|nr:hypothetical protein [Flavobacterium daejeonense]